MNSLLQFLTTRRNKNYPELENNDKESLPLRAPGTKILYDPGLIKKLHQDHKQLVAIYSAINKAIDKQLHIKIHGLLNTFLALFNEHALAEYTKLYVFLDYSLRSHQEEHQQVMTFRKEMQEIGKVVRLFVHNWKNKEINSENASEFSAELQDIGKVLSKRISVEEKKLYQIYADAPNLLNADRMVTH